MNETVQNYKGLPLMLVLRNDYGAKRAKEYHIISKNGYLTDLKIWIPNSYLSSDGTIDTSKDFLFIFSDDKVKKKVEEAGYRYTYK